MSLTEVEWYKQSDVIKICDGIISTCDMSRTYTIMHECMTWYIGQALRWNVCHIKSCLFLFFHLPDSKHNLAATVDWSWSHYKYIGLSAHIGQNRSASLLHGRFCGGVVGDSNNTVQAEYTFIATILILFFAVFGLSALTGANIAVWSVTDHTVGWNNLLYCK